MTAGTTPHVSTPSQVVPVIINWVGAAGWLAQHYCTYASYRPEEEEYIRKEICPYLEETAAFYEDFIRYNADGTIKIYPSVSPENTPQNFYASLDGDDRSSHADNDQLYHRSGHYKGIFFRYDPARKKV